jgi:hypothetical protein
MCSVVCTSRRFRFYFWIHLHSGQHYTVLHLTCLSSRSRDISQRENEEAYSAGIN